MTAPDHKAVSEALERLSDPHVITGWDYVRAERRFPSVPFTPDQPAPQSVEYVEWHHYRTTLSYCVERGDSLPEQAAVRLADLQTLIAELEKLRQLCEELEADAARLDYIERTYSGMTNRERYLPVQMIWGKGCNGRTLREACDKYMKREAAIDRAGGGES
jgi:hypothetical protein